MDELTPFESGLGERLIEGARARRERAVRRRGLLPAGAALVLIAGLAAVRPPWRAEGDVRPTAPDRVRDTGTGLSGTVAASCVEMRPVRDYIEGEDPYFDTVFVGVVSAVEDPVQGGEGTPDLVDAVYTPVRFEVEDVLRGDPVTEATLLNPGGELDDGTSVVTSVTFGFVEGRRYLVVAHGNADGTYSTNICVPTQDLGPAS